MNAFSICANPGCGHAFQAGQGRFFRFHQSSSDGEISNAHGVCHYWLCDGCAEALTLKYQANVGIVVANRFSRRKIAA
jgi:hypothetical protein